MTRLPIQSLLIVSAWLAWLNSAYAQAPAWTVVKVERSATGFVTEIKLNPISGLYEEKKLLVLGEKNEFLNISLNVRPDRKGFFPEDDAFKVVEMVDGKQKIVGKQTFFFKGRGNVVTMVFRGNWTKLDGLSLAGPGPRSHALGKAAPKKK